MRREFPTTFGEASGLPRSLLALTKTLGVVTYHSHLYDDELYTLDFSSNLKYAANNLHCSCCGTFGYEFVGEHVASSRPISAARQSYQYCLECIMKFRVPTIESAGAAVSIAGAPVLPAVAAVSIAGAPVPPADQYYTLQQLQIIFPPIAGIDLGSKERYLSDTDFQSAFGMDKLDFQKLDMVQKNIKKKELKLTISGR